MHPPLFSDLTFDDALAKAKEAKKILLVDASASWCQPCKHMDRTTWVDASVVAVVGERAIAIQFDVDEQKELAQKLSVRAMPTVIAFRDGAEIDRVVGMRPPAEIVTWLDGLTRGETSLDTARKAARENATNVEVRLRFARALLQANALDEATTEHVWIWEHILEHAPSLAGMKYSFFVQQIAELVKRHPPAREAFARIRDAAKPGTLDWFCLNQALDETAKTLEWFDTVKDRIHEDEELATNVENIVIPLLVAVDRWADAGRAYASPLKTLERLAAQRKKTRELATERLSPEQAKEALGVFVKMELEWVTTLRRALFEARRDDDLRAVDEAAAKIDPAWAAPLDVTRA